MVVIIDSGAKISVTSEVHVLWGIPAEKPSKIM
jgi:hypothetical protein